MSEFWDFGFWISAKVRLKVWMRFRLGAVACSLFLGVPVIMQGDEF